MTMADGVLICGDTVRCAALRHEVPVAIGDPFLYAERDGHRVVLTNVLEVDRIAAAVPELERLLAEDLGRRELIEQGLARHEVELEVMARAVERVGLHAARVPPDFPLALADLLRGRGVELVVDHEGFDDRRRRKTQAELAGIRRATAAGLASLAEAARILREASIRDGVLHTDGDVLTSELLRGRLAELCGRMGATLPPDVIVAPMGPDDAVGHESGSGPLPADTPICLDLWPQDEASGCWTDMTRTYIVGEISDAFADLHRLVREAHERALERISAGAAGAEPYDAACDVFEAAGHPTQRTAAPGEPLAHGFFFSLGHGVGLEVHEAPLLSRKVTTELVAGDVVAVEPGLVVPGVGGMRVEDLVLVGDDGVENLTAAAPDGLRP
jgi:Xaa-Pro aminopeptidase